MNIKLDLLNKKLELIQWLSTVEDSTILEEIMDLRKRQNKDWWNSISENEKEGIEKGLKDAESGKLNPHSSARKLYEKWL
jgi:predicted transcriptional regulator